MTVELGTRIESRTGGSLTERKDTFQYVPLLESVKALLKHQEVLDEVCGIV